jgi:hypothetical protein
VHVHTAPINCSASHIMHCCDQFIRFRDLTAISYLLTHQSRSWLRIDMHAGSTPNCASGSVASSSHFATCNRADGRAFLKVSLSISFSVGRDADPRSLCLCISRCEVRAFERRTPLCGWVVVGWVTARKKVVGRPPRIWGSKRICVFTHALYTPFCASAMSLVVLARGASHGSASSLASNWLSRPSRWTLRGYDCSS